MHALLLLFRFNPREANSTDFHRYHRAERTGFLPEHPKLRVWNGEPHTVARVKMQAFMRKNRRNSRLSADRLVFAGFGLENIELRKLSRQNEIAVIHRQVAGDSVFISLNDMR